MTDISKEAVDALIDHLRGMGEHEAPPVLDALRAALDEAEVRAEKAEAERDAANALLRQIADLTTEHGGAAQALKLIRAHLGAKP